MKKLTRAISLVMVLCMMFSTVAFAAEDETVEKPTTLDELNLDMEDVASMMESASIQGSNSVNASAPPLTEFYIYGVYSENQPDGERIQRSGSFYQTATMLDHGGSWLIVITIEVGYAGSRFAYFKNSPMKLADKDPLDFDGDSIIDGYACYWLYEGDFTNGMFRANSKSANSPWNTMSIPDFNIR